MDELLLKLKEVVTLKSSFATQEAAAWQKLAIALDDYVNRQKLSKEQPQIVSSRSADVSPKIYMDTRQAGEYLSLSAGTLNKWRVTGGGPKFLKIGRSIRYKIDDLDEFITKRRYPHTSAYDVE